MDFATKDEAPRQHLLHNLGTISLDGSDWLGGPWANIAPPDAGYPLPAAVPSLTLSPSGLLLTQQSSGDSLAASGGTAGSLTQNSLTPEPGLLVQAAPKFDIIASYDTSIANLQTSNATLYTEITSAITSAISFYEAKISSRLTIGIDFIYGSLAAGVLGESVTFDATGTAAAPSYSSLIGKMPSADAADLPATDPTSGGQWFVSESEALALGLLSPVNGVTYSAGVIYLNSNVTDYNWNTATRAVSSKYDSVGVLQHEITEVMGREESLGQLLSGGTTGTPLYTPMDLLRFSSAGTHDLTPASGYFSLDNGTTDLAGLNNPNNGGDSGDWAGTVVDDSFDASATIGVANTVSATDLTLLHSLGYSLAAACYAAGTHILTATGEKAVESLEVGELVETRFSGPAAVTWIGHRRLDCTRHPDPEQVWPIRVAADAFGPGQPSRDLLLSGDHSVAVADTLVPIRLLLNGGSIRQESGCSHVHYVHVELNRHDIIFANGLPAETYLDTGNRALFDNGGVPLMLHPNFDDAAEQQQREARSCLPLLTEPANVLPIWQALAERAKALGFAMAETTTTDDPALCIATGQHCIVPISCNGGRFAFVLPASKHGIRLRSRFVSPASIQPWLHDRRQLGVRVSRIVIHGADGDRELALDDPGLTDGWWAVERDDGAMRRWTDGDAVLPPMPGPVLVEVTISDTLSYPVAASAPTARVA